MSRPTNALHFIITGGTIDSRFDGSKDTVVPYLHSVIPAYIKGLKLYMDCEFTEICMKDSREMTPNDVKAVLKTIEESSARRIIVTHGTYTMPDTARYVKANLKRNDQVIIFTASMIPIAGFSPSDGPFNIGFAIAKTENLDPGVYVCMNGRVFNGDEVLKIINEGRFTSIFQS
jgi:L-asparaginase